eukprot:1935_1
MMTFFEIILIAANLSVQSSGIPTILSIIEKESINANESPFLFIMLIINGLIGCTYSILTSQTVMFVSQICAIVFGIIYLYTFHHYSVTERKQQIQLYIQFIIIGFIFVSTFVIFTFYHNEHIVIQFVGILGLLSAIMLMSSPLCVMKAVIRDGTSIYLLKTTVIKITTSWKFPSVYWFNLGIVDDIKRMFDQIMICKFMDTFLEVIKYEKLDCLCSNIEYYEIITTRDLDTVILFTFCIAE